MSRAPARPAVVRLDPEKVAYWYIRLNGFFQIENFVVHPERRGGQRTDADLLAIRFPFRAERLFDDAWRLRNHPNIAVSFGHFPFAFTLNHFSGSPIT